MADSGKWEDVSRKRRKQREPQQPSMHSTFDVDIRALKRAEFPVYGPPVEIATYSTMVRTVPQEKPTTTTLLDADIARFTVQQPYQRTLCSDNKEHCSRLVKPQLPYDLKVGYGSQIEKNIENEFISLLLECLARDGLVGQSEFVCGRRLLRSVSKTPYDFLENNDCGMVVVVQRFSGVLYMYEHQTQESLSSEAIITDELKQIVYGGSKFESYVTDGSCQGRMSSETPINFNNEFCSAVKTTVGSHSLITRGQIDCTEGQSYIELKTHKELRHDSHIEAFRCKHINWWLQTSLVGVKDILCGFRDANGIVRKVERYKVDGLPAKMAEHKPAACLKYLDELLSWVKANVVSDFIPHVLRRKPRTTKFEMELDEEGKHKFIPLWFAELVIK